MKLINQKCELLVQQDGLEGIYKHIEAAARTCYKSEHLITSDSANKMIERLVNNKHTAMLEHGTVYLKVSEYDAFDGFGNNWMLDRYGDNAYSHVERPFTDWYITTNYRVLVENEWMDDLKYICEPTEYHEKRYTVKVITDRAISHELVRHKVFSFAQESQRYCNYSKDKYNNSITFCIPCWINLVEGRYEDTGDSYFWLLNNEDDVYQVNTIAESVFLCSLYQAQSHYFNLLGEGWKPEQARAVLPNATKTEIVMTGFESDWKHFLNLRYYESTGPVHPQMKALSTMIKEKLKTAGFHYEGQKKISKLCFSEFFESLKDEIIWRYHLLTKPFNVELFKKKFPDVDVLKNSVGTLLYKP